MSEPAVTITITNSGYVDVKYTPPRPGGREFRQEAAALCMFLLVKIYGHTIKMPGAMHRAKPHQNQPRNQRGQNHG